jgi:MFS family permease
MGFNPVQSGLLIMAQSIAAMSLKITMPKILARFGYRRVLISNTLMIGLLTCMFVTIGIGAPIWGIVVLSFCYGFFSSLQYTSMSTLVYADVSPEQASAASSIASTLSRCRLASEWR